LKPILLSLSVTATALVTAALFAVTAAAQTPQAATPPAGGPPPMRSYPAPTNLKALPKDMTGQQVHEVMEKISGSLGVHCDTCHAADPTNLMPNGRPRMNFADDSKPEKVTARLMILMSMDINKNYISKIDNSGAMVTCGTCHRGHLSPEPFVIPDEHGGPRPPMGAPPSGAMPMPPPSK
jgi:cytochrome c553